MTQRKKLIEVALPLEAINEASAREKSIRHGHPSTLHLWWARRPLAAARAVIFTSLVDDPDDPQAPLAFVQACRELPKGKNATANDTPRQHLEGQAKPPRYVRQPFQKEPDFGVTSINYNLLQLLENSKLPIRFFMY